MYEHGVLTVSVDEARAQRSWDRPGRSESAAAAPTATARVWRDALAKMRELSEIDASQRRRFLQAVPLRVSGDGYSFVHKSFYEYFLAEHLLRQAGLQSIHQLGDRHGLIAGGFEAALQHERF